MIVKFKKDLLSVRVYETRIAMGFDAAQHEVIAKKLNADFYFAHPYSSWERGLNEYTNKLIRQYIIKGSNFDLYDSEYFKLVQNKINRRPRETL